MQTVAELPEFIRRIDKLLSAPERAELIAHLAVNPKAGVILRGAGGIRKLRWGREGSGKGGGVRVIYYFHDDRYPLYLLTVFGKGEKDNLSVAERIDLAKLVRLLVKALEGSK